jgi:ribosomal protein L11 methyltransferase
VLAMAAARVWPGVAIAGDIDPLATATARANVAANGLAGRVACVTAAGFRHPRLRAGGPYDLIFANILAGPLRRLAGELARHHAAGGVAILSGILARQAAGVVAVYRGWGYRPADAVRIDGWSTLVLARR